MGRWYYRSDGDEMFDSLKSAANSSKWILDREKEKRQQKYFNYLTSKIEKDPGMDIDNFIQGEVKKHGIRLKIEIVLFLISFFLLTSQCRAANNSKEAPLLGYAAMAAFVLLSLIQRTAGKKKFAQKILNERKSTLFYRDQYDSAPNAYPNGYNPYGYVQNGNVPNGNGQFAGDPNVFPQNNANPNGYNPYGYVQNGNIPNGNGQFNGDTNSYFADEQEPNDMQ